MGWRNILPPQRVSIIAEKSHTMSAGFLGTAAPASLFDFQMQVDRACQRRLWLPELVERRTIRLCFWTRRERARSSEFESATIKAERVVDLKNLISVGSYRTALALR